MRVVTADSGEVDEAGTLAFLDNAVDSLTGTVTAKARFANQSNGLWPGEYVRVSVELEVQAERGRRADARGACRAGRATTCSSSATTSVAKVRPISVGRAVGDLTTIDKGLARRRAGRDRRTVASDAERARRCEAGATPARRRPAGWRDQRNEFLGTVHSAARHDGARDGWRFCSSASRRTAGCR